MVRFLKFEQGEEKKEIPIRIGYSALKRVKEKHGKSVSQMGDDDLEMMEDLMAASIKSGYRAIQKECLFNLEDPEVLLDIMDECLFQFKEVMPEFFPNGEGAIPPEK